MRAPAKVTAPVDASQAPVDAAIRAEPPGSEPESFGSPASMPLPEIRAVSPLSRRTTPLPNLKSIFEYEAPSGGQTATPPQTEEEPSEANEELSPEGETTAEETAPSWARAFPPQEDFSRTEPETSEGETDEGRFASYPADEVARLTEERDNARRDYAMLRSQFEILKQEQGRGRGEPAGSYIPSGAEGLQEQLAARDREMGTLKMSSSGLQDIIDSLRHELNAAQAQAAQFREEASIAQRGLALSQKALQETRDALREASEGSSHMKNNLEHLKNECSTLVQQNMLLQAQHDQLVRELATAKAKPGSR